MDKQTIAQFKQTITRLAVFVAGTLNTLAKQADMRRALKKWVEATIEVMRLITGDDTKEAEVLNGLFKQLEELEWERLHGDDESE